MEPTIYLFFKGNCLEAMTRYANALGGEITSLVKNSDAPNAESRMPGGDDLVMNMSIALGDATIMASDAPEEMYTKPGGFRVSIAPTSREEFERIHDALAEGTQSVQMAPEETFWAERFAMFIDRYGTPWMLNFVGTKSLGATS